MERRDFIVGTVGVGIGIALANPMLIEKVLAADKVTLTSKVVIAHDPAVFSNGELVHNRIVTMIDRAVTSLMDISDPLEAWRKVIVGDDSSRISRARVAIKVNTLSGKRMCTHPELAMTVARRLLDAGFPEGNVLVWDRSSDEMKYSGYYIEKSGPVKVYGTNEIGYSNQLTSHRFIGSFFSRIVTEWATDLINIPVLKDHGIVGVSLGMKNLYGTVHNPNKYHPNAGDPYVADLSDVPYLRDKLRLVLVDGFEAQYNGGPPYQKPWAWRECSVLASKDPVAVDRVGWSIIETKRHEHGLKSLAEDHREPKYIFSAEKLGLGIADLDRIVQVNV
jgi:uncharacterized protein (DUF362 family)